MRSSVGQIDLSCEFSTVTWKLPSLFLRFLSAFDNLFFEHSLVYLSLWALSGPIFFNQSRWHHLGCVALLFLKGLQTAVMLMLFYINGL